MNDRELIKQIKSLRNTQESGYSSPQSKERIFNALMTQIQHTRNSPVGNPGIFGVIRYFQPSRLAMPFAMIVLIAGTSSAFALSRTALPGQSLYGAKVAFDQTQVRFVSNPAERAKVQMEIAGRRLEEARQVSASDENTAKALKHFSKGVHDANESLKSAADPLQVESASAELAKKAHEYEEKLLKTKEQVAPGRQVGVAAIEEAEQALDTVVAATKQSNAQVTPSVMNDSNE